MDGEKEVVGLNHSSENLSGWVNEELQLGILAINQQRCFISREVNTEPAPPPKLGSQGALKTCAPVSQFPDLVQDEVIDLLGNDVVSVGIVIGSFFLR